MDGHIWQIQFTIACPYKQPGTLSQKYASFCPLYFTGQDSSVGAMAQTKTRVQKVETSILSSRYVEGMIPN